MAANRLGARPLEEVRSEYFALLRAVGMKPSPEFGRILSALYDAQLDGEFSDLEGGLGYFHRRLEGKETR